LAVDSQIDSLLVDHPFAALAEQTVDAVSRRAITEFRARPEFGEAVARMRPLLDSIETFTLDGVAKYERTVRRR
jgi:hypothetical protein